MHWLWKQIIPIAFVFALGVTNYAVREATGSDIIRRLYEDVFAGAGEIASAIAHSGPAPPITTITLCNALGRTARVATINHEDGRWVARGWWIIARGQCGAISLPGGVVYIGDETVRSADAVLQCAARQNFSRVIADTCQPGDRRILFERYADSQTVTWVP